MALKKIIIFLSLIIPLAISSNTNDLYGLYNYTFNYFNQSFDKMLKFYWDPAEGINYWDTPDAQNYWDVPDSFNVSYELITETIQRYYQWVQKYQKFNNYFINESDNYLGMFQRVVQFIVTDQLIDYLNTYTLKNITVYKQDTNGSYTDEIDYTYPAPPYNHTWFSDLLPNDFSQFLGEIHDYEPVSTNAAAGASCGTINDLPDSTSTRINENEYCPSVGYQEYGDCWSWSSTTQANCNYNQKAASFNASLYGNDQFSELYTDFCSNAGDVTTGGSAYYANKYFVEAGACSYYKYSYPGPNGEEDEDQECEGCIDDLTPASSCYQLNSGDMSTDFKNAHYWVGAKGYAMSVSMTVGGSFYNIGSSKGSSPVDTVCDGDDLGGHAMTIVGTSNKWDYEYGSLRVQNSWGSNTWGDDGYFWLSREAYVECGYSITFNTFGEYIEGGEVIDINGWTPNNNTVIDNGGGGGDDIPEVIKDGIDKFLDLGTGAVIGIIVGGLVLVVLICVLCRCLRRRKRRKGPYVAYQKMDEL